MFTDRSSKLDVDPQLFADWSVCHGVKTALLFQLVLQVTCSRIVLLFASIFYIMYRVPMTSSPWKLMSGVLEKSLNFISWLQREPCLWFVLSCYLCQCKWFPAKTCLWNDLLCVEQDVKLYSLTFIIYINFTVCNVFSILFVVHLYPLCNTGCDCHWFY